MLSKNELKNKRKFRIRKKVSGTAERPRLSVFKSNKNFTIQAIDDAAGKTLVSISTMEKDVSGQVKGINMDSAAKVAGILAERAKEKGISKMVFDRNGNVYHGRVKQIAESLRENGIEI